MKKKKIPLEILKSVKKNRCWFRDEDDDIDWNTNENKENIDVNIYDQKDFVNKNDQYIRSSKSPCFIRETPNNFDKYENQIECSHDISNNLDCSKNECKKYCENNVFKNGDNTMENMDSGIKKYNAMETGYYENERKKYFQKNEDRSYSLSEPSYFAYGKSEGSEMGTTINKKLSMLEMGEANLIKYSGEKCEKKRDLTCFNLFNNKEMYENLNIKFILNKNKSDVSFDPYLDTITNAIEDKNALKMNNENEDKDFDTMVKSLEDSWIMDDKLYETIDYIYDEKRIFENNINNEDWIFINFFNKDI